MVGDRHEILKYLLDRGADANCANDGHTPLQLAGKNDCLTIIEMLLHAKADVNARPTNGEGTILDFVFRRYLYNEEKTRECSLTIKFLIEHGARAVNDLEFTVRYAGKSRNLEVLKSICEYNSKSDGTFRIQLESEIERALSTWGDTEIVTLLVEHRTLADLRKRDLEHSLERAEKRLWMSDGEAH